MNYLKTFHDRIDETPAIEYATVEYADLLSGVDDGLVPNHIIRYVPFSPEQTLPSVHNFAYAETAELTGIMAKTDAILCISRDEELNPEYTEQYPDRNIVLTLSGEANVDKAVELFKLAQQEGNSDIKFIATGRMHNRAIRMMLALPVFAEFMGVNAEDIYHIPEAQFRQLLDAAFTPENINRLDLSFDINPEDDTAYEDLNASRKAAIKLFNDPEYAVSVPNAESSPEELQKVADAIFAEYKKYPRISTSELMIERAVEQGVPREAIFEEEGSVDTISNFVNTAEMMSSVAELRDANIQNVAIVAGSDHLPRTTWIADHILPDGIELTCVESDPRLSPEAYSASCIRELNSFYKGSKWIGGTRDLEELVRMVEVGYFSADRKDAAELAQQVAAVRSIGSVSVKN